MLSEVLAVASVFVPGIPLPALVHQLDPQLATLIYFAKFCAQTWHETLDPKSANITDSSADIVPNPEQHSTLILIAKFLGLLVGCLVFIPPIGTPKWLLGLATAICIVIMYGTQGFGKYGSIFIGYGLLISVAANSLQYITDQPIVALCILAFVSVPVQLPDIDYLPNKTEDNLINPFGAAFVVLGGPSVVGLSGNLLARCFCWATKTGGSAFSAAFGSGFMETWNLNALQYGYTTSRTVLGDFLSNEGTTPTPWLALLGFALGLAALPLTKKITINLYNTNNLWFLVLLLQLTTLGWLIGWWAFPLLAAAILVRCLVPPSFSSLIFAALIIFS